VHRKVNAAALTWSFLTLGILLGSVYDSNRSAANGQKECVSGGSTYIGGKILPLYRAKLTKQHKETPMGSMHARNWKQWESCKCSLDLVSRRLSLKPLPISPSASLRSACRWERETISTHNWTVQRQTLQQYQRADFTQGEKSAAKRLRWGTAT
jgi:hypothetical protein